MRGIFFSIFLISLFAFKSYTQTTYSSSDYPNSGEDFPFITISSQNNSSLDLDVFRSGNNWVFDTVYSFTEIELDTAYFLNPNTYDTSGTFSDATHLLKNNNQDVFIKKNDQSAEILGFSGDILNAGIPFEIRGSTPLRSMEFPTNTSTAFDDDTSVESATPLESLEAIIPDSIYDQVSEFVDSVKIMLTINDNHEILNETNLSVNIPGAFNGTYNCLCEKVESTTEANIYAKAGFFGWVPISDIPGFEDMLPIDLPFSDVSYFYRFWNPEFGRAYTEIELNSSLDSALSIRFIHESHNSIANNNLISDISLYPNPASNYFYIDNKNSKYKRIAITDQNGRIVKRVNLEDSSKISIEELKAGLYFVSFFNKNNIFAGSKSLIVSNNLQKKGH